MNLPITWKYFPKWFCRFTNKIFGIRVIARNKLFARLTVEKEEDLRILHGINDQESIIELMTMEIEESLKQWDKA